MPDDHTDLSPGIYLTPSRGWGGTRDLFARIPGTSGTVVKVNRLTGELGAQKTDAAGTSILMPEPISRTWLRTIEET